MKFNRFEDMLVWQESRIFVCQIYEIMSNCNDYGFKSQMQRAAVSIMNNIAEGFERKSNKEFVNILFIAKGSCGEVRSMLYLSEDLCLLSGERVKILQERSEKISRMISTLIKYLKTQP
jgi:four helix bundle protein